MQDSANHDWQVQDRFLEMHSRWMTLIGEHLKDDRGEILEYWRVEKADSVIVLAIQGDRLLLPAPSYRCGIGKSTLDFAGGRSLEGKAPIEVVPVILQRELGIHAQEIIEILPINTEEWAINSSFSNQKLYGFVASINATANIPSQISFLTYHINPKELHDLRKQLTCIQCRALLMEWILNNSLY
jgi:hypothetical protein